MSSARRPGLIKVITSSGAQMPRTNLSMSISADGYVAGPSQSEEHPLGIGGQLLHGWHLSSAAEHPVNRQVVAEILDGVGATIMRRNMFGPIRGDWGDSAWTGWRGRRVLRPAGDPPGHRRREQPAGGPNHPRIGGATV